MSMILRLPMPASHAASWLVLLRQPGSLVRWVAMGLLLSVLVCWAAVGGVLAMKWRDALETENQHSTNLARILQEQTVRVLATTDQATIRLRDTVRAGEFAPHDIVRFANETGLAPRILTQLSLIGADGRFMGSNLDPDAAKSGRVDLSTREHVQVHLAPQRAVDAPPLSSGGLFIGKPVLGKVSGKWTIQLSRRIDGADGQVLGVVVASLDPTYFEDLYRGVALGDNGGVAMIGSDGVIRARVIGGRSAGVGDATQAARRAALLVGDAGLFESVSPLDGALRRVSYRRVGDYPLYVNVLRDRDEALASWRDTRTMALGLTAGLTLAMLAAAAIFAIGVRRLEESNAALRASEAEAHAANQAKTEFLAAVSHELRTPLTSIRGFAELMETRLPDEKYRHQAGLIRRAAEHLNKLLTEILDLVKVEANAMPVRSEPVALRPLLEGAAAFFAVTAAEKGLALDLQFAPDVPDTLLGDELRLQQILNNLLSNAFKFTERGSVTIALDADVEHLFLHVVDTGPGIPESLHALIFERFSQGDGQVSYQHGGTGLGLALSRALAELMGGTLGVSSKVGMGSRFTLTLPRVEAPRS